MKNIASFIVTLLITVTSLCAGDGKFYSQVIHETDGAFALRLPSNKFIKITNFTQSGSVETEPGVFTVGAVYVYQGAPGLPGITALTAGLPSSNRVLHEDVYIAGPVIVYVPPVAGATLLLSYLLGNN